MSRLIRWFIDRSLVVNLITVFVIVAGVAASMNLPRKLLPSADLPVVILDVKLPGASALDMERFVTFRLEDALTGTKGLEKITSTTINGAATLNLTFEHGHDDLSGSIEEMKRNIDGLAHVLPGDLRPVQFSRPPQDGNGFYLVSFEGADPTNSAHRQLMDSIAERLDRLPGVARTTVDMPRRDLHISFDAAALTRHELNVNQVRGKIAEFFSQLSIGQIRQKDREIAIEIDQGFDAIDDLKRLPLMVNRAGRGVTLGDVAKIGFELETVFHRSLLNGNPRISIGVE